MDKALQEALEAIQERNRKVKIQKAWEVSLTRRAFIAVVTYIVAATYMYFGLGIEAAHLHAFVPTGGYLLSTFSLPLIKDAWIKHHFNRYS